MENLRHADLIKFMINILYKINTLEPIDVIFTMYSDTHIDAKAREAYSTGQNVYVPGPQVSEI